VLEECCRALPADPGTVLDRLAVRAGIPSFEISLPLGDPLVEFVKDVFFATYFSRSVMRYLVGDPVILAWYALRRAWESRQGLTDPAVVADGDASDDEDEPDRLNPDPWPP